jgi:hypothetical protein
MFKDKQNIELFISEKKIVVYISPENVGNFLTIVKEKNFIEVVSRSISQVSLQIHQPGESPDPSAR